MSTTGLKKARTVGPESSPNRLAMLDGRTREAAMVRKTRADLLGHIKNPTVVQRALVERASWLTLRLNLMEARLAGGEEMSDHASRQYVALSNALRRVLDAIGIQAAKAVAPSLADYLAARPAAVQSSAPQTTPPALAEPAMAASTCLARPPELDDAERTHTRSLKPAVAVHAIDATRHEDEAPAATRQRYPTPSALALSPRAPAESDENPWG